MAANDYYSSPAYAPKPYRDYSYDNRADAPLPPLPTPSRSYSPYQDNSYHSQSNTRPHAGDGDPYDDENSIPLNGRKKHDSTHTISPILPHEQDDPFVRDADPRKQKRRLGNSRGGWFTGKITWVVYVVTVIQLAVFLAEIIKNGVLTGTPIEIHPSFNPMIGPSFYVQVNMGARYQPCMHNMPNVQNNTVDISWPCPNATATSGPSISCSLSEFCGFNGVPNPHPGGSINEQPAPNQWWRFIVPIFLHAGIVHIGFNLLLQLTLGRDVEKLIGSVRFAIVYFASGIFGFVLGGNFAGGGIASSGCSGSLFGILAITLLDLLYTWRQRRSPYMDLAFIVMDVVISFVLGLLPGLDNFSHIGGWITGLVLGVCLLRSPYAIARRSGDVDPGITMSKYVGVSAPMPRDRDAGLEGFVRNPVNFFKGRRGIWWAWWLVRALALIGVVVCFILLLKNFYVWRTTCSWCKYLSCLPVTVNGQNWCNIGDLNITSPTNSTSNNNKRWLGELAYDAGIGAMDGLL